MTPDPWAHMRHIDGQPVVIRSTRFLVDADGSPVGVDVTETPPTVFRVPALLPTSEEE